MLHRSLLALALVGCGGESDSPTGTTGTTGDTGSAGSTTVTVASGGPFVGATVALHGPTGSLLETATTNVAGQVVFDDLPPGGAITVLVPGDTNGLVTLFGLTPGEDVFVNPDVASRDFVGAVEVTLDESYPAADDLLVTAGCTSPAMGVGQTRTYEITENCVAADGTVSFLAEAYGGTPYGPMAHALVERVAVGSEVGIGGWSDAYLDFPVNAANAPDGTGEVQVIQFGLENGVELQRDARPPEPIAQGQTLSYTMDRVVPGIDRSGVSVAWQTTQRSGASSCSLEQTFTGAPGGVGVDLTADLMARPSDIAVNVSGGEISWTMPEDPRADGLLLILSYTVDAQPYRWLMLAPVGSGVAVPELPSAFTSWWGGATPEVALAVLGGTAVEGYGEFGGTFPPSLLVDAPEPGDQLWSCLVSWAPPMRGG